MAIQLKHTTHCLCSILLLVFLMSQAKAEPCKCPDSDQQDRWADMGDLGLQYHLIDQDSGLVRTVGSNLLRDLSDSDAKNKNHTWVLSTIDGSVALLNHRNSPGAEAASFVITIVYQPLWNQNQSGITFLILPAEALEDLEAHQHGSNGSLAKQLVARANMVGPLDFSKEDLYQSSSAINGEVSVNIGVLANHARPRSSDGIMAVDISFASSSDENYLSMLYTVCIKYNHFERRLSVYMGVAEDPQPDNAIAEVHLNISTVVSQNVYFGLLSTVAQKLHMGAGGFRATILYYIPRAYDNNRGSLSRKVTILSSVLGSAAATAALAAAIAYYLNSKYRQRRKELEKLARSMERLPGVPIQVEFADIKKATRNFHDDMKLGAGGFGAVYRCTLPAAASKTGQPMEVAVKRFTRRGEQNRCYDDFLAEVSIINRLRHKNIVPLVGWSYHKGEPLLVFEFMTNGSLDQHLFPRAAGSANAAIRRWATRYEIVRGIATGLHYVHHEYEPVVLHRDIKASNIMLDSSFCARLGDFGLACTVAVDRNSATGVGGTWGYIAPEYAYCGKATRQTDIYALGVLILEVVTGKRALLAADLVVDEDDVHITDRVWRLHREGRLGECVDTVLLAASSEDNDSDEQLAGLGEDTERLLLLGLACSNPNPSDRPSMPDVVQVIAKSAPPPEVPSQKPRFVWPPPEWDANTGDDSTSTAMATTNPDSRSRVSMDELQTLGMPPTAPAPAAVGHASFELEHSVYATATSSLLPGEIPRRRR
ncbi:L-type lectin-domain containing receptor kinase IX.1 [Brachypodium distachyon]|uniref:L-type lectin-domain containing receptor kinase IX.1 n=1 Tax=Brachypodium distachyon TaxID=15368 RepID=UPI0001C74EE4|nr:L-type lectin-domain containing receptor kinase IX.1 [Brachypodium distachyon]|eukprot:XP_024313355.1 L-type lectin-domain containing receptor kinase IX.1 [Brachypodium distachyon]